MFIMKRARKVAEKSVSFVKENTGPILVALGIGALYVIQGLSRDIRNLEGVVTHNAKVGNYEKDHAYLLEKTKDGYTATQVDLTDDSVTITQA